MNSVTQFLDIEPLNNTLIGKNFHVHELDQGIANMNERSLKGLSDNDQMLIEHHARELLQKLGYLKSEKRSSEIQNL